MADITVTAANVGVTGDAKIRVVQVGESVTQGQPGYQSSSDQLYYQTDANASAEAAGASGVFMSAASTNGYALYATSGNINLGATLTAGEIYVVSATKGAIAPIGDSTTGWYVTILGVAATASSLVLNIVRSNTVKP